MRRWWTINKVPSSLIVLNFTEPARRRKIYARMKVISPRRRQNATRSSFREFRAIICDATDVSRSDLCPLHRQFDRDGLRARDKSQVDTRTPRLSRKTRYFRHGGGGAVWFTSHRRCIINRPARASTSIINRITGHSGEISLRRRYVLPAGLTVINGAEPFVVLNSGGQVSGGGGGRTLTNRGGYQNFKDEDNAARKPRLSLEARITARYEILTGPD